MKNNAELQKFPSYLDHQPTRTTRAILLGAAALLISGGASKCENPLPVRVEAVKECDHGRKNPEDAVYTIHIANTRETKGRPHNVRVHVDVDPAPLPDHNFDPLALEQGKEVQLTYILQPPDTPGHKNWTLVVQDQTAQTRDQHTLYPC